MKKVFYAFPFLFFFLMGTHYSIAQSLTPKEIVKRSDDLMQGESSISTMTMEIVRPTWKRSISLKSWGKGRDKSVSLVTAPARDKGQSFLKVGNEMWSWNPSINRLIKLPPSMLSQGWMGSDYTNDDILKESSIVNDYDHSIVGEQIINGLLCYIIEMKPKADAAVVWGKINSYISKEKFFTLKAEYFDEDGELVRTSLLSDIKIMDDREMPTRIEIIPADEPENRTIIVIESTQFNTKIADDFFSQQNMKRLR
jgi:outer membrane lipoprotein-sorting protein